jgi:hypothetical protein
VKDAIDDAKSKKTVIDQDGVDSILGQLGL